MLLANISVAKKIFQHFPEFAVLRRHPSPPPANYDILVKAARSKVSCCFCFSSLSVSCESPLSIKSVPDPSISL